MDNTNKMNYEEMFKWVAEQVRSELEWTNEDIEERGPSERLMGMRFAYGSILGLIENLEEKGYENYKKECEEITEKYKEVKT